MFSQLREIFFLCCIYYTNQILNRGVVCLLKLIYVPFDLTIIFSCKLDILKHNV